MTIGRWRSLGRVFEPSGEREWMVSHASVPFGEPLANGYVRVWFSPRDRKNRSSIASLIIDPARPSRILDLATSPTLNLGEAGTFDDSGTMMSWLLNNGDHRYLYYIGWNQRVSVPFHVSIGLATGCQDKPLNFVKQPGPILDRSTTDALFCSNPCVIYHAGRYHMWYLSGRGWAHSASGMSASYFVAYAHSSNGVEWSRTGHAALALEGDEFAIARPSVMRDGDVWRMWFSQRGRDYPYRLGSASSHDGCTWERDDASVLLQPGIHDWASEMVAYPHVFNVDGKVYMLYCGNGFGRAGFGLAVFE
jgi:hypothetical protein